MQDFSSEHSLEIPLDEERAAAKSQPGGWLYRIAGGFAPTDAVPPEAICGAWKIDDDGNIVGAFIHNPNYDPSRFPLPDA
jgi:hypothetical protein